MGSEKRLKARCKGVLEGNEVLQLYPENICLAGDFHDALHTTRMQVIHLCADTHGSVTQ
jgi:hypothetical protein